MSRLPFVAVCLLHACAGNQGGMAHHGPQHGSHQGAAHGGGHGSAHGGGHEAHPGPDESGMHHGHSFADAEGWAARFEDPARDVWQKPDELLAALGLAEDARVADLGAGTGYFAVRLAKRLPRGRVWGIDIEPNMVRYLNGRADKEGLNNLFSTLGLAEDPLVPEPVDLVLVVDTYHHIAERVGYFARLRPRLRSAGRLVIVDFRMGELPVGPPEEMKLAPEVVARELGEAGFVLRKSHELLPHQYVLEFSASP